jgi:hypothetical protein
LVYEGEKVAHRNLGTEEAVEAGCQGAPFNMSAQVKAALMDPEAGGSGLTEEAKRIVIKFCRFMKSVLAGGRRRI